MSEVNIRWIKSKPYVRVVMNEDSLNCDGVPNENISLCDIEDLKDIIKYLKGIKKVRDGK